MLTVDIRLTDNPDSPGGLIMVTRGVPVLEVAFLEPILYPRTNGTRPGPLDFVKSMRDALDREINRMEAAFKRFDEEEQK